MDIAEAAKRSQRKRQPTIDVAIIYNVDFEEARFDTDPCFQSRATVESVAEEVASAICYLASDDASYITGAIMMVDGGSTAVDVLVVDYDEE